MPPPPTPPQHAVLRCDAGGATGVGHAVRCLALAQELRSRGWRVTLLGAVTVGWVAELARQAQVPLAPAPADPAALAARILALGAQVVVLDGYELDPRTGAALRAAGLGVLAMVDGDFGAAQEADVYVDQNLGAAARPRPVPGAVQLTGLDAVLLRDSVRRHRRSEAPATTGRAAPRVLTVFGGTDPFGATGVMAPLVLTTGLPLRLTSVTGSADDRAALAALPVAPGQVVEPLPPTDDLPGLAAGCDLVVTAAGSTVWELLHVGVATAVVCVADNQLLGYRATTATGATTGLGELAALRDDPGARAAATGTLADLLADTHRREAQAAAGRRLVDGRGRERVADLLADLAADLRHDPAT